MQSNFGTTVQVHACILRYRYLHFTFSLLFSVVALTPQPLFSIPDTVVIIVLVLTLILAQHPRNFELQQDHSIIYLDQATVTGAEAISGAAVIHKI